MEKLLSQDEINALFSTMSADETALAETADPGVTERIVTKYDFCRSDRVNKEQIRALQQLNAQFGRLYSNSLSAYLRTVVEISPVSVEQISYQEFLKLLSDPTLFCALSIPPVHGTLAMELTPPLVLSIIDMLLGGPGKPAAGNRPLTDLEIQIIEGALKLALRELKEAWRPILEINPQLASVETRPQMLQLIPPGESVVAVSFEVKLGEVTGMLNLCIPSMIMRTNRSVFELQRRPRRAESETCETEKIGEILRNAPISLSGEIRDQVLVVEDLLNVAVGDIIQLNHAIGDPIQLNVGGIPKFRGRIVARRGKRVFEISHKFNS